MIDLSQVTGVIHVGASTGQERDDYAKHDLKVLWIEPRLLAFATLLDNLKAYPKQRAVCALLNDRAGEQCTLHVANNGDSSSLFPLAEHRGVWPDINYEGAVIIESRTLDSIDTADYDALVLDVQGAELLVLKGAVETLRHIKFIQAEAYDAEMYKGGSQPRELRAWLVDQCFDQIEENASPIVVGGKDYGNSYELVFKSRRK